MKSIYISGDKLKEKNLGVDFAVLPLGSIEFHGYHSIIGTDYVLADYFGEYLSNSFNCAFYPTVPYTSVPGKTMNYPGTINIRPEIMTGYLCDVINGIAKTGIKKIIILNAHDGNISIARSSAEWVTGKHKDLDILILNWWQFTQVDWVKKNCSFTGDSRGHGGAYEISAALFAANMKKDNSDSKLHTPEKLESDFPYVRIETKPKNWDGYIGNPNEINIDDGEKILTEVKKNLKTIINAWIKT